ncbi:MAG: fumarylacetoacetate hydrolase family protein [Acidobacteriaceae bacterium]|nr:fumarylacetoacetate hydrolase family protein [Acidobacteriaceae bacterium]
MKLVRFVHEDGRVEAGVVEAAQIRVLQDAGDDGVLAHIKSGSAPVFTDRTVALDAVKILAPMQQPPNVFGIGLNYREHAAESKMAVQAVPTVFLKLTSSITGPDTDVLLPPNATQPDYEAELAVVIGKGGHRIAAEDWEQHVFGYTILNDVSARGVQLATSQWNLGKSFPTFTPMGPWIVTADEIGDPHELGIKLTLSGEVMQKANTRDLIFRIPELIAYLSSIVPLQPGDVISTGTPPGVGLGRTPQRWLKPDEEMVIEIEKIGTLRNTTRAIA